MSHKPEKATSENEKGNIYDKIFKENGEDIFRPIIEKKLGFRIRSWKRLRHKHQTTLEKEMDFFYEVLTEIGEKCILHLEYQSNYDVGMLYRISEYHGVGLRRYKKRIIHVVLYLGDDKPVFQTTLPEEEVFRGFEVINIHEMDTDSMLSSQVPAEVINAILSNYPPERIESVLRLILMKLGQLCVSASELDKYLQQLFLLSRLRKAESVTIKIINEMSLLVDIEKDTFYLQGLQKGKAEGKAEGAELALRKTIENLILKMKLDDHSIADITEADLRIIRDVRKKMALKK